MKKYLPNLARYKNKSFLKNLFFTVLIVIISIVGYFSFKHTSLIKNISFLRKTEPVVADKTQLFVASKSPASQNYNFTLYDLSAKKIISQKIIDLYSSLPPSPFIDITSSNMESSDAFNNPMVLSKSGNIYLFFGPARDGQSMLDPNFKMPPFISAIYKTTFNSKDKLKQIYTTGNWDRTFYPDGKVEVVPSGNGIDNVIYDNQDDRIYFRLSDGIWMTINPLDDKVEEKGKINDGITLNNQIGHINKGNISMLGKVFKGKNSSDVSQDWIKLSNYNFDNGKRKEKILAKNCLVEIHKGSLSPNDKTAVFSCSSNFPLSYSVLDIETNKLHNLPELYDYNFNWSGDGSKFLFATKQGLQIYDIATHSYSPFDQHFDPYLWESNTRYIVGQDVNNLVIYDLQTKELQNLNSFFEKSKNELYYLQWN